MRSLSGIIEEFIDLKRLQELKEMMDKIIEENKR